MFFDNCISITKVNKCCYEWEGMFSFLVFLELSINRCSCPNSIYIVIYIKYVWTIEPECSVCILEFSKLHVNSANVPDYIVDRAF